MPPVVNILFGASFTVATAWALGTLLLRRLSLDLYRSEERLLSFIVGAACLSQIIFLLCAVHLAYRGVFLALGIAIIGAALFSGAHRPRGIAFTPLPQRWFGLFVFAFGVFTVLYLLHAMAPETSADGMAYHLGVIAKYQRAHGFPLITNNIYASLSQGLELLFLFAFEYGKHSAAALVHFAFLVALALLILSYGRRIGHPAVGVTAAILTYASPVVGMDGTSAYIDVGLATVLFALFCLLQVWDASHNFKALLPIGILAGFGYAMKYTALLALPYAVGFIAWKLWRARKPWLRPVLLATSLALAFVMPWMVKNWIEVANPLSPFANRLFPNPYVHISFEDGYTEYLRHYGLTSYWQVPLELTVKGDLAPGAIGPIFLLAPLALLALRSRVGRQVLLAAAIFALPYLGNIGGRFMIPAVPFLSLALALVFSNWQWLLFLMALAQALAGWPAVNNLYAPKSWIVDPVPLAAALRIQPEDVYLNKFSEYRVARMLDRLVPPNGIVFSFSQPSIAYMSREVLVGYESGANETLEDTLWCPIFRDFQPTRIVRFLFPASDVRKIRLLQTAKVSGVQWSVSELRVLENGQELPRAAQWRLTAHPNPWEVQLAFDNSPVTRWRSWQIATPGMYIEIDFGHTQKLDAVQVETSVDSDGTQTKLQGMTADGKWFTLSDHQLKSDRTPSLSLRQAATAELKAHGIRYLLITPDDIRAQDFLGYSTRWGLKELGRDQETRLYYIE